MAKNKAEHEVVLLPNAFLPLTGEVAPPSVQDIIKFIRTIENEAKRDKKRYKSYLDEIDEYKNYLGFLIEINWNKKDAFSFTFKKSGTADANEEIKTKLTKFFNISGLFFLVRHTVVLDALQSKPSVLKRSVHLTEQILKYNQKT